MEFRRSGQLDDRRRRVLRDEITAPATDTPGDGKTSAASARGPIRAYAPAVLDEHQLSIADLVPRRPFTVLLLGLVGLTLIAAIEGAYIHLYGQFGQGMALHALDLTERGSIAHWFASLVLALGAIISLVVFSIRSHRVDDYRGQYRIWLWAVGALLWGSLDAATGVHASLNDGLAALSGMDRAGLGSMLWLAVYGLVFGGLGIRLSCELWPSLEAFGSLAVAAMLYVGSAVCHLGLVQFDSLLLATVVTTLATLLAHGALVYSIGLFARHVHLDAQGRLLVDAQPVKKKSRSKAKLSVVAADDADEKPRKKAGKPSADPPDKESAKTASGNTIGAAISAAASKPAIAKPTLAAAPDADDEDDSDEDLYDDNGNKLSKSERRRLKKMARREQQRRAA